MRGVEPGVGAALVHGGGLIATIHKHGLVRLLDATADATLELPEHAAPELLALSTDAQLLAAASRKALSVMVVQRGGGAASDAPRAALRWRVELCAVPKGLDLVNIGGVGASARALAAVGSSMGLELVDCCASTGVGTKATASSGAIDSSDEQRRLLLLPTSLPCCVRFSSTGSSSSSSPRLQLAAATLDGGLSVFDVATTSTSRATLLWRTMLPPALERVTAMEYSPDASTLALSGWNGAVATYDCSSADDNERASSWRLRRVWDCPALVSLGAAPPPAEPAPTLVAWCRAPHAAGLLVVARSGRVGDANGGALALIRALGDGPAPAIRHFAGAIGQVRGLCTHSSPAADGGGGGAEEMVCWMDAEGEVHRSALWKWQQLAPIAATVETRAYRASELLRDGLPNGVASGGDIRRAVDAWVAAGCVSRDEPRVIVGTRQVALAAAGLLCVGKVGCSRWSHFAMLRRAPSAAAFLLAGGAEVLVILTGEDDRHLSVFSDAAGALQIPHDGIGRDYTPTLLADEEEAGRFVLVQRLLDGSGVAEYRVLRGVCGDDARLVWSGEPGRVLGAPWRSREAPPVVAARGDSLFFELSKSRRCRCDVSTGTFSVSEPFA